LTNLEKARALLADGNFGSCVLYNNGIIHASGGKGISPMLDFIEAGIDLKGFSAADTVCGKALALLFSYAGVNAVYADLMSEGAVEIFKKNDIRCVRGELVDVIKNRAGTGLCPMERAVENIDEPKIAYATLAGAALVMRRERPI
jgi:hypothetical protein